MKTLKKMTSQIIALGFSKTAKNTYFVFTGNVVSMFFAFIFTVILARILSLSDLGYFSALLSLLLVVSDVCDIGIGTSLARFLPTMKNERLSSFLKTAFLLQLSIASIIAGLIFLFSQLINNLLFHESDLNILVKITAFGVFGNIMANFFFYSLMAKQKFVRASFYTALGGVLRVAVLFILIIFSLHSLTGVVVGQVLSLIVFSAVGLYFVGAHFLRIQLIQGDYIKLISFSIYLGIARGLTAIAGKLDVLMLIALTNPVEAGIYSIASRVISIYPLLSGSFTTVIAPKIATMNSQKELKNFLLKVGFVTLGLIATIIFFIVFAYPFMYILFGIDKGVPAVSVFRLLLVSMIFFVGSIPAVSLAVYFLKKPNILTINSILQLVIVVIGNLIFIPLFKRNGAALSLILAYGLTLFTTSLLTLYYYRKRHE